MSAAERQGQCFSGKTNQTKTNTSVNVSSHLRFVITWLTVGPVSATIALFVLGEARKRE